MGKKPNADDERRVALDVLQELRQEKERSVHSGINETAGQVGAAPGRVRQEPQRQYRLLRPTLIPHESA